MTVGSKLERLRLLFIFWCSVHRNIEFSEAVVKNKYLALGPDVGWRDSKKTVFKFCFFF